MNGGKYHCILVVEDEQVLRQIISRNLTSRGHVVYEAPTVEAAIAIAADKRPDLVLLDINLPGRSGWDVLRELRQRGIEIPTIIISAVRVSPSRLAEFQPLAYLPKPFPLEALLRLVVLQPKDWQMPALEEDEPKRPRLSSERRVLRGERPTVHGYQLGFLYAGARICHRLRTPKGRRLVNWEYVIIGFVAVLLLGYLVYSLIRPERF